MTSINGRRPHWRATHADTEAETHQCFAYAPHAGEWLTEQLHHRPVDELGGLYECIDATEWLARLTDGIDADGDDPAENTRWSATVGGVVYSIAGCTCGEDVTGRCQNSGCDRDDSYDSEPQDGPDYTRWFSTCARCLGRACATGGFSEGQPVPEHQHQPHTAAYLAKLIEDDQHVGWWCTEYTKAASDVAIQVVRRQCRQVWRFSDASWVPRWRLTRIWDGTVTGTQGYALTEAEAVAEAGRLNARSAEQQWGFTVGVEPIESK